MKVLSVAGARPNFMKIAPLHRAFENAGFTSLIVHTGQHYDQKMSDVFFRQLEMPEPHLHLGVGSGTHAQQTARIMTAFEEVLVREAPDLVVVVGDVNSTLACSLVAAKLHVPVAHVEAGLRSGDRRMPEEVNRLVTDALSDFLFVTEQSGLDNLRREGVPAEKVFFVGNVMIDSLVRFYEKAARTTILETKALAPRAYVLMTMHRPSNVDDEAGLLEMVTLVEGLSRLVPVVFPMHPRTRGSLERHGLFSRLARLPDLCLMGPVGYLEFLQLMAHAGVVVTDSGGVQEETTYLQVPCLTLRESTERPVTVELGTNELMPLDAGAVERRAAQLLQAGPVRRDVPPLWDGRAAERIAALLADRFMGATSAPGGDGEGVKYTGVYAGSPVGDE